MSKPTKQPDVTTPVDPNNPVAVKEAPILIPGSLEDQAARAEELKRAPAVETAPTEPPIIPDEAGETNPGGQPSKGYPKSEQPGTPDRNELIGDEPVDRDGGPDKIAEEPEPGPNTERRTNSGVNERPVGGM